MNRLKFFVIGEGEFRSFSIQEKRGKTQNRGKGVFHLILNKKAEDQNGLTPARTLEERISGRKSVERRRDDENMPRDRGRGTTASARNSAKDEVAKSASGEEESEKEVKEEENESEEENKNESEKSDRSGDEEDDANNAHRRKVETPEARKRRIKDENMAIARAQLVKEKVRLLTQKANAPAIGEQKRKATHWSYVMAEMKWLARDFAAERDWKLEAARQVALTAGVANGVPVGANERRNQMDAKAARQVAKQVSAFWEIRWEEAKKVKLPEATELAKLGCGGKRFALEAAERETNFRLHSSAQAQTSQRLHRAAVNAAAAGGGGGGSDPQTPRSDDGGANTRTNSARSTPPTNVSTPLTDVTGYGEDSRRDDDEMFLVSFDPKTPEIPRGSSMKSIERWAVKYLHRLASLEKAKAVRQAVDAKEAEEEEDDEETATRGGGRKGRQAARGKQKDEKKEPPTRKGNKRKRDATPEPPPSGNTTGKDTDAEDMETDVDTEAALSSPEKRELRRAQYARDLKLDEGGLELDLDALIAPYSIKKKLTMRGLKSFKRDDEAAKKEGDGSDDEDDDDQSMSSGGKNGEDDDDEKSDAAEDFFFDFPALQYDAYESVRDEFEKSAIGKEANKFAEYERRLREWEDRERARESHLRAQQKPTAGSAPEGKLTPAEERRRAFFAAAAARGHFFDQEGYVVDKNGKRKKNKKGQFVRFHPGMEEQFGVKKNGNKKGQKGGAAAGGERKGAAKAWTATEDALLCAIVHEFGSNWALVADAFGASASLKGSYRRPELCRWRFQQLTRAVELENDPEAFAALNLDKGSARVVMSRSLPLEDETARLHFQAVAHSCSSYAKIRRAALRERVGMDPQKRIKPHQSWKDCVNMFSLKSPAELAHLVMNPMQQQMQQQQQQQQQQQMQPQQQMQMQMQQQQGMQYPTGVMQPPQHQMQSQMQMTANGVPMQAQQQPHMQQMPQHVQQQRLARAASKTEAVAAVAAQQISSSQVPQLHRMGSYQPQAGKGQAAMSVGGMVGSSPARPRGGNTAPAAPGVANVATPAAATPTNTNLSPLGSGEKQPKQGLAPGIHALTPKSAEKEEKKSKEQVIAEKTTVTRTGRATKKVKK